VPVWRKHNTLLDGHTQQEIRERHGLTIRYVYLDFENEDEAVKYALQVQMGRRNIDKSQRAIVFAKNPRLAHGGDRKSTDQGANLPLEKLAEAAGVSERTMKSAAKVVDHGATEVIDGVRDGDFAVFDAAAIVKLDKKKHREIVTKAKDDGITLREAAKELGHSRRKKAGRKGSKKGSGVVGEKQHALQLLKELSAALKSLRLFKKLNTSLTAVTRAVKALKIPTVKKPK
jgi:hypothetical protein